MIFVGGIMKANDYAVRRFPDLFENIFLKSDLPTPTLAFMDATAWTLTHWPLVLIVYMALGWVVASTRSDLFLKYFRRAVFLAAALAVIAYPFALLLPLMSVHYVVK